MSKEFNKQLKRSEKELKQALIHLKDNPWFHIYQESIRAERENFVRTAYQYGTTDQDRLLSLGAVALADVVTFKSENASPKTAE